jgi:gliding motility-associated-like protein
LKTKYLHLVLFLCALLSFKAQKLLINEVSQGVSGNTEFIELIVNTANPGQCPDPEECVDIRNWIFDDNNGYFSNNDLTGTGFAQGSMRFSNNVFWSCLKPGTLITIYDVATANPAIPTQDLSVDDGNCMLVIPITSNLFERHLTRPDPNGTTTYSTTGWLSGGLWSLISMNNDDDSFQLRDPANLNVPVHAVSYGNNTFNNFIYFAGSAGGISFQCVNTTSDDFHNQLNWLSVPALNQSAGVYNSVQNESFSDAINPICGNPFIAEVDFLHDVCGGACDGSATLNLSGGSLPYGAPLWSTLENTNSISNLCPGNYSVAVTDNAGCDRIVAFEILTSGANTPIISANGPIEFCEGGSVTLTSDIGTNILWSNGLATQSIIVNSTGSFSVTLTEGGCVSTSNVIDVVENLNPVVDAGPDIEACGGLPIVLLGSGASIYVWDNGITNGVSFIPTGNMTMNLTGTDENGCSNTDQMIINFSPMTAFDLGPDIVNCDGTPVTYTLPNDFDNYLWSDGSTSNTITITSSGQYNVTAYNNGSSNIIQNGDFSGGTTEILNNFTTDYTTGIMGAYGLLTNAGTYAISTSPSLVHFNFLNFGDHTSGNGNMLIVNGSGTTNTSIWCQTVNVDPNTDYDFSCWATNTINDPNISNLQFFINGSQIGNVFSTTSNANDWQQFSNVWNSGSNTTAQLCITNQNTTEPGNDFAIDDIFFSPICSINDTVNIVIENVSVDAGPDQTICAGESVDLAGVVVSPPIFQEETFTNTGNVLIFDNFTVNSTINVSGITNNLVSQSPIVSVCLNIDHTYTADLEISLECPDGTVIDLSSDNGGSANDYTNTCFVPVAPIITGGTAPFTGEFSPENNFSFLDACNVNGVWTLIIHDNGSGDTGTLEDWEITFNNEIPSNDFVWSPLTDLINETTLTPTATPTATTTYTLTLTSPTGNCIVTDDVTLTVNGSNDANFTYLSSSYCTSETNPSPTITTAGGTFSSTPVGLVFLDNVGTIDLSQTIAGTYTITYSLTTPCNASSDVVITITDVPIVDIIQDIIVCDGEIINDILFTGTVGAQFDWTNDNVSTGLAINGVGDIATFPSVNGTNNPIISVVEITPSIGSCIGSPESFSITVNPLPIVDAGLDVSICSGADVTLVGSGALSYVWDNGITDGVVFNPNSTLTYTVIGTDANGCENTDQVTVTMSSGLLVDAGPDLSICEGQSVTLSIPNGQNITWDNGITNNVAFVPISTTTYTVSADDGNGCFDTDDITVTVNALAIVDAGLDVTVCDNTNVTLTASGANTYSWDNGVSDGIAFDPAFGLGTVTYTVIGTDVNGCQNSDQLNVTVLPLPIVDAGLDVSICPGADVTLVGSGALSYVWDNGITDGVVFNPNSTLTYTVIGTDANGCENTDQVMVTISSGLLVDAGPDLNVCEGQSVTLTIPNGQNITWDNGITNNVAFVPISTTTYTVSADDGNGCFDTDDITVTVNALPIVDAGNDLNICENSNITLNGNGANTYVWDNGVTDGISFIATTNATYTVTGTDVNGCISTDNVSVTVISAPIIDAGPDQSVCLGEDVVLTATGALNYVWDNGVSDGVIFNPITTQTYTVTGTDGNACQGTDQVVVTIASSFVLDGGADLSICLGESATLTANNGQNISWDNNVINGVSFTPNQTNTYTVIADDGNGCFTSDQVTITVNSLPILDLENDFSLCVDALAVTLQPNPSGGTWTGESITSNGVFNPVNATSIDVPILLTYEYTDNNNCTSTQTMNVTVNSLPNINAGLDVNICPDATITLSATGGISYVWDNNVQDGVAFIPSNLTYTVIGTDANACVNSDDVLVTIGTYDIFPIENDTICFGESITVSTGNATSYVWTPANVLVQNGASATITPTSTTTFTVVGTNNACEDEITFEIFVKPIPTIQIANDTLFCRGNSIFLSANGNANSYQWENGIVNNSMYTPLQSDYISVIGELNDCFVSDSILINLEEYPQITILTPYTEACTPMEVQFNAIITDAVSQLWEFGDGTTSTLENPNHVYSSDGYATISLAATSSNGCTNSVVYDSLIHAVLPPVAQFTSDLQTIELDNSTVQFINLSTNANAYEWSYGDSIFSNIENPIFQFDIFNNQNVLIQLIAHASSFCVDTAYLVIEVKENELFYVPNSFTPNDDELNQTFKPIIFSGINFEKYNLKVFNRWGELIFESNDPIIGWDGTYAAFGPCKSDTYVWKLTFETNEEQRQVHTGHVNLIK